jgi:hypothetical protein
MRSLAKRREISGTLNVIVRALPPHPLVPRGRAADALFAR